MSYKKLPPGLAIIHNITSYEKVRGGGGDILKLEGGGAELPPAPLASTAYIIPTPVFKVFVKAKNE